MTGALGVPAAAGSSLILLAARAALKLSNR